MCLFWVAALCLLQGSAVSSVRTISYAEAVLTHQYSDGPFEYALQSNKNLKQINRMRGLRGGSELNEYPPLPQHNLPSTGVTKVTLPALFDDPAASYLQANLQDSSFEQDGSLEPISLSKPSEARMHNVDSTGTGDTSVDQTFVEPGYSLTEHPKGLNALKSGDDQLEDQVLLQVGESSTHAPLRHYLLPEVFSDDEFNEEKSSERLQNLNSMPRKRNGFGDDYVSLVQANAKKSTAEDEDDDDDENEEKSSQEVTGKESTSSADSSEMESKRNGVGKHDEENGGMPPNSHVSKHHSQDESQSEKERSASLHNDYTKVDVQKEVPGDVASQIHLTKSNTQSTKEHVMRSSTPDSTPKSVHTDEKSKTSERLIKMHNTVMEKEEIESPRSTSEAENSSEAKESMRTQREGSITDVESRSISKTEDQSTEEGKSEKATFAVEPTIEEPKQDEVKSGKAPASGMQNAGEHRTEKEVAGTIHDTGAKTEVPKGKSAESEKEEKVYVAEQAAKIADLHHMEQEALLKLHMLGEGGPRTTIPTPPSTSPMSVQDEEQHKQLGEATEMAKNLAAHLRVQHELKKREMTLKQKEIAHLNLLKHIQILMQTAISNVWSKINNVQQTIKHMAEQSNFVARKFLNETGHRVLRPQELPLAYTSRKERKREEELATKEGVLLDCPVDCAPKACDNKPNVATQCFRYDRVAGGGGFRTCVPFKDAATATCPEPPSNPLPQPLFVMGGNMHSCLRLLAVHKEMECSPSNLTTVMKAVKDSQISTQMPPPRIVDQGVIFEGVQIPQAGEYKLCMLQFWIPPEGPRTDALILGVDEIGKVSVINLHPSKAPAAETRLHSEMAEAEKFSQHFSKVNALHPLQELPQAVVTEATEHYKSDRDDQEDKQLEKGTEAEGRMEKEAQSLPSTKAN